MVLYSKEDNMSKGVFIFKLFEKYGYNRSAVMKLLGEKRLTIYTGRLNDIEIYCIDYKEIFRIQHVNKLDFENNTFISLYKEVFKDETNGSL